MGIRISGEVIKVFEIEIDSTQNSNYDELRFRVEIISDQAGQVRARIWRKEFYRLQPTFPQEGDKPKHESCDELILVEEAVVLDFESVISNDWNTTLSLVLKKLRERFDVK